jgi:DNA-binding beta-propeller fold protein YncE
MRKFIRKVFIDFFVPIVIFVVAVMAIPGGVVKHSASPSLKHWLHIAMAAESTSTPPQYNVLSIAGTLWGDGKSKTDMKLHFPQDHIFAPDSNVYICDGIQSRVRKIDSQGNVSTVAGTYFFGFTDGLGGPATEAILNIHNCSLALHGQDLYILQADGNSVLKVNLSTGILTLVAGTPDVECEDPESPCGDEGPATEAQFTNPRSVRLNPEATALFVSDFFNNRVRKVDLATGIITTVAGNGQEGSAGDDGLAINAQVTRPDDVAFDSAGNMYIAEQGGIVFAKLRPQGSSRPTLEQVRSVKIRKRLVATAVRLSWRN